MDRILDRTVPPGVDGVAGLMSRSGHLETLSSKVQHLGHERHVADRALAIQRLQDLLWAKYLDPVADVVLHVAPPLPAGAGLVATSRRLFVSSSYIAIAWSVPCVIKLRP